MSRQPRRPLPATRRPQPVTTASPAPITGILPTVMRPTLTAAALAALLITSACTSASYHTRIAYLRKMADRGVETHNLLTSQGARIDAKRCGDAYEGLKDNSPPADQGDTSSTAWLNQVKQFFVDSCVTGYPKPVPGDTPQPPAKTSTSPATPTPSVSPSPTKHT
jgi:hypothetical protein